MPEPQTNNAYEARYKILERASLGVHYFKEDQKWYITDEDTEVPIEGPFDTESEALDAACIGLGTELGGAGWDEDSQDLLNAISSAGIRYWYFPRDPSPSRDTVLFVYGTLQRGYGNNRRLARATFLGTIRTKSNYRIYASANGGVPAVMNKPVGSGCQILGELWFVPAKEMPGVDALEGHPHNYFREAAALDFTTLNPDGSPLSLEEIAHLCETHPLELYTHTSCFGVDHGDRWQSEGTPEYRKTMEEIKARFGSRSPQGLRLPF